MKKIRKPEGVVLEELRSMTERKFGLKKASEELGFSASFLCQVIKERRPISDKLAAKMGYRRVVEYERIA